MTLSSDNANMVDLLVQSSDIVVGRVASVTDGIDERGIPYTEIELAIEESIRGELSGEYSFRQFGLLNPRILPNGQRRVMSAPAGFPKYESGESVVLFLRPAASWTGFRMPAGVTRGKFSLGPGHVANDNENAGLFDDVRLEEGLATTSDSKMMTVDGPADPDTFLTFVRRAVRERWLESGRMSRAGERGVADESPPSDAASDPAQTADEPTLDASSAVISPSPAPSNGSVR